MREQSTRVRKEFLAFSRIGPELALCAAILLGGCNAGHPSKEQLQQVDLLMEQRTAAHWKVEQLFDDSAPPPQPTGALTLQDATECALTHNLSLLASAENLSIAHAQLVQAGLLPNPTFGQTSNFAFPISPNGGLTPFDLLITQSINGILTQPTRVAQAHFLEAQANIDMATQAYALAQQVDSKYQEMVHLARDRILLEKINELYQRAVVAAEARRKVGIIPTPELNRARLSLEDGRRQLSHTTTQYARAAREMNWLMGYSDAPQWQLPASAIGDVADTARMPDVDLLQSLGLKFRMDLLRADFDRKLGEKGIVLAKFGLIPQTEFGFDYSWDTAHHHAAGPQFGTVIPIFDPGLVGLELAKAQKRKADKTYAALKGQVRQDVRTAYDNWRIAADDVSFFRDHQIPQQEENVRLMELSFRLGNDDLDSLLNIYQNYVSQLQSYEDAIQAYHDAGIALQQSVGLAWNQILAQGHVPPATQPTTSAAIPSPPNTPTLSPAEPPTTEQPP